jgi:hypothetical protein
VARGAAARHPPREEPQQEGRNTAVDMTPGVVVIPVASAGPGASVSLPGR